MQENERLKPRKLELVLDPEGRGRKAGLHRFARLKKRVRLSHLVTSWRGSTLRYLAYWKRENMIPRKNICGFVYINPVLGT